MMRVLLLVSVCLLISSLVYSQRTSVRTDIEIDKKQARKAYELLNDIRTNPAKYAKELGIADVGNITQRKLVWNDDLAKVAEFRAMDMANRNYFDHVSPEGLGPNYYIAKSGYALNKDWLKKRSDNNFESIAGNHSSAVAGIEALIIGKGSPGFMHRKHLLGMDKWNGSLIDIGIGFVQSPNKSTYKTYLCVIIAKHDW